MTRPDNKRRVLLFVDGRRNVASRRALETAASIAWPEGIAPQVVDVEEDRELATWYGLVRFPCLALVDEGMLLAVEHECTQTAGERIAEATRDQAHRPWLRRL